MPKLSTYTADYTRLQTMPWDFWTQEQRSLVIQKAYKELFLTSAEIKPYLDISRKHYISQWAFPLALAGLYSYNLKDTVFRHFYRKSVLQGRVAGTLFLGVSTLLWLNLSPFYIKKEEQQEKTLQLIYTKVGTIMKAWNDFLPRSTTSGSLDRGTRALYNQRNHNKYVGKFVPEEDSAPPLLPINISNTNIKRIYQ